MKPALYHHVLKTWWLQYYKSYKEYSSTVELRNIYINISVFWKTRKHASGWLLWAVNHMHETILIKASYIYKLMSYWLQKASITTLPFFFLFFFLYKISSYGRLINCVIVNQSKALCISSAHCSWHTQNIHATTHTA